jgi:hypothetical protein
MPSPWHRTNTTEGENTPTNTNPLKRGREKRPGRLRWLLQTGGRRTLRGGTDDMRMLGRAVGSIV